MAVNKVEANGETLIDLTSDTVTADTLLSGRTAHLASGVPVTGTFEPVTGVKGNAESAYRKGNVNLTPANIGAATSAQGTKADSAVQTIQIGGTTQTKTDGTVNLPAYPTKSSLGLGNVNNTSDANKPISTAQQIALNSKVAKDGDTMTGELRTSFGCVANGSINVVGDMSLSDFVEYVRHSSGCTGSVYLRTSTFNDITIPEGWYNFEWLPHRTGGVNGEARGDNCNYGTLILTGMTVTNAGYIVRYSGLKITEVHELYKCEELEAQVNYNTNQGVKNLCRITAESQTINGVTFTVDKVAGTITANGTATDQISFKIVDYMSSILQVGNKYTLSGCPAGGNYTSTYALYVFNASTGSTVWADTGLSGGSSYVILSDIRLSPLYILIRPGVTVSNIVFKPMIRYASIKDNTFEPYAEPNYQLTQKVDKALEQTKALIPKVDNNHNGIFRGKDLTNVYTIDQMYSMIHGGNFDDLFLGDYFTKSITTDIYTKFTGTAFESGVKYYERSGDSLLNWTYTETSDAAYDSSKTYYTKLTKTENVTLMFAAFDYYYNVGDTALTTHHAILIPRNYGFATISKMNPTNTTVGGYYNSEMHKTTLPCYAKSLKTALNNHLLSHRTVLPNVINANTPSMAGAGFTGASSGWEWTTVELQLMSEAQIYGTTVWSSSAYDVGVDYKKLPVFDFINGVQYGRGHYWLRSVVSSTAFALCNNGLAGSNGASNAFCVRPLILFG